MWWLLEAYLINITNSDRGEEDIRERGGGRVDVSHCASLNMGYMNHWIFWSELTWRYSAQLDPRNPAEAHTAINTAMPQTIFQTIPGVLRYWNPWRVVSLQNVEPCSFKIWHFVPETVWLNLLVKVRLACEIWGVTWGLLGPCIFTITVWLDVHYYCTRHAR